MDKKPEKTYTREELQNLKLVKDEDDIYYIETANCETLKSDLGFSICSDQREPIEKLISQLAKAFALNAGYYRIISVVRGCKWIVEPCSHPKQQEPLLSDPIDRVLFEIPKLIRIERIKLTLRAAGCELEIRSKLARNVYRVVIWPLGNQEPVTAQAPSECEALEAAFTKYLETVEQCS